MNNLTAKAVFAVSRHSSSRQMFVVRTVGSWQRILKNNSEAETEPCSTRTSSPLSLPRSELRTLLPPEPGVPPQAARPDLLLCRFARLSMALGKFTMFLASF